MDATWKFYVVIHLLGTKRQQLSTALSRQKCLHNCCPHFTELKITIHQKCHPYTWSRDRPRAAVSLPSPSPRRTPRWTAPTTIHIDGKNSPGLIHYQKSYFVLILLTNKTIHYKIEAYHVKSDWICSLRLTGFAVSSNYHLTRHEQTVHKIMSAKSVVPLP